MGHGSVSWCGATGGLNNQPHTRQVSHQTLQDKKDYGWHAVKETEARRTSRPWQLVRPSENRVQLTPMPFLRSPRLGTTQTVDKEVGAALVGFRNSHRSQPSSHILLPGLYHPSRDSASSSQPRRERGPSTTNRHCRHRQRARSTHLSCAGAGGPGAPRVLRM